MRSLISVYFISKQRCLKYTENVISFTSTCLMAWSKLTNSPQWFVLHPHCVEGWSTNLCVCVPRHHHLRVLKNPTVFIALSASAREIGFVEGSESLVSKILLWYDVIHTQTVWSYDTYFTWNNKYHENGVSKYLQYENNMTERVKGTLLLFFFNSDDFVYCKNAKCAMLCT